MVCQILRTSQRTGSPNRIRAGAEQRALEVAGVAVDEDGSGAEDEDGGENGVSPDAVGAGEVGTSAPIHKTPWWR